jgi:hypothetical protein
VLHGLGERRDNVVANALGALFFMHWRVDGMRSAQTIGNG